MSCSPPMPRPTHSLSSNSDIPIASFGIGIIRVTPDALGFEDVTVGSPSAAEDMFNLQRRFFGYHYTEYHDHRCQPG